MKKLFSILLSLALLLALTVPALAAPEEETGSKAVYELSPEVEEWIRSHSQAAREFHAGIDAYVVEEWGYPSVAEMAAEWEESEEYIRAMLTEEWAMARIEQEEWDAWIARYEAENPGAIAALEANAYAYYEEAYSWYTPEEYMEIWEMTEEEFIQSMVVDQLVEIKDREDAQRELERAKTGLGGVPGQMGVMLNGEYIPFSDALPEAADGRIMVPYRALMEALGGDVAYDADSQTVSCILGDTTLTFRLGESTLNIQEPDVSSVLVMDCAAYAKDGRTFVPVRFISQAFGYDVLWDQGFETVVLLDREALIAEIDSQFAVLNRMLSNLQPDYAQARETTGELNAALTLFDSISGDETYDLSADFRAHTLGLSGQGEVNMDLSALTALLDLEYLLASDPYYEITVEEQALARQLIQSLTDLSLEYIIEGETGSFYLRSPLLSLLEECPEGAWLAQYTGEPFPVMDQLTMGSLCYTLTLNEVTDAFDPAWLGAYLYSAPVSAYANVLSAGYEMAAFLGDGCFTPAGEGHVFTLDPAALGLDGEDPYSPFSELVFTLTVAESGAAEGSLRMVLSESGLYDLTGSADTAAVLEGVFSLDETQSFLLLDLHVKNVCRLELEMTTDTADADAAPLTAPPEGELVIDSADF